MTLSRQIAVKSQLENVNLQVEGVSTLRRHSQQQNEWYKENASYTKLGLGINSNVLAMNSQNHVASLDRLIAQHRSGRETFECRLTMGRQSETNWQRAEWRSEMQPGVMAGGALIPLLGEITPEFFLFLGKCLYLYNSYVRCDSTSNQPIHIPTIHFLNFNWK